MQGRYEDQEALIGKLRKEIEEMKVKVDMHAHLDMKPKAECKDPKKVIQVKREGLNTV